jgi:hypothetical protein
MDTARNNPSVNMGRMRVALKILAGLAAVYILLSAALFAVMEQPPERFARIIAKLPWPLFVALPLEPLWKVARTGHLRAGDAAPDFDLETLDKTARVRLSAFRGQKPVVLVFGSYT